MQAASSSQPATLTKKKTMAQALRGSAIGATMTAKGSGQITREDSLNPSKSSEPSRVATERFPTLTRVINSHRFETMIGALIVSNCFTMGLEAEQQLGKAMEFKKTVQISEHILTACFLVEFLLRLFVFGPKYFCPAMKTFFNFVDMLLVLVTGVTVSWILPLVNTPDSDGGIVRTLTVLRAVRLVRLVRVVRKVELFHEVYVLLRGLTESVRTLVWTIVVVFFLTYVFAVFGVVLISVKVQEEYEEHLHDGADISEIQELYDAFCGVFPMMYTLVQVLTYDSWNGLARPLMNYVPMSWIFFYLYMAFAVIVLMNLVTAIIVENALAHSKRDEDAQLRKLQAERQAELEKFGMLFEIMDKDGDGFLTFSEFQTAFEEPEVSMQLKLLDFHREDLHEVFALLDTGDGLLSLEEFYEGITRMQGLASAKDTFRIWKTGEVMSRSLHQFSKEVLEDLGELMRRVPGCAPRTREGSLRARASRPRSRYCTEAGSKQVAVQGVLDVRQTSHEVLSCGTETHEVSLCPVDTSQTETHVVSSPHATKIRSGASTSSGHSRPLVPLAIESSPEPPPDLAPPPLDLSSLEVLRVQERIQDLDKKVEQCKSVASDCKSAVESCREKVDFIGGELSEMRTTMLAILSCLHANSGTPQRAADPERSLSRVLCCGPGTQPHAHIISKEPSPGWTEIRT